MTRTEAEELPNGIYLFVWSSGNTSTGVVNKCYTGGKRIQCSDWTSDTTRPIYHYAKYIKKAVRIL